MRWPVTLILSASNRAGRIAVRNGLTDYGMPLEEAERWCDAWELEAATREILRTKGDTGTLRTARSVDVGSWAA